MQDLCQQEQQTLEQMHHRGWLLLLGGPEGIPHFMDLIYHKETSRFLLHHLLGCPSLGKEEERIAHNCVFNNCCF